MAVLGTDKTVLLARLAMWYDITTLDSSRETQEWSTQRWLELAWLLSRNTSRRTLRSLQG